MLHLYADDLEALDRGSLPLFGQVASLEEAIAHPDPLYRYAVHELAWIHAAFAATSVTEALRDRLRRWLASYLARFPDASDPYWDPFPLSSRILNARPLVDVGAATAAQMMPPVARWWRALSGLSETHLGGNHLLRNRCAAVCAAAMLGRTNELRGAVRSLLREARRQFWADGTHEERTPGYHWQSCRDLLMALQEMPASPAREQIAQICEAALSAMEAFTHQDDRLAAFGDTAPRSLPVASTLAGWARRGGLAPSPPRAESHAGAERITLPRGGFTVVRGGRLAVYVNHGDFGAPHQPGHAHCDLFAIEVDVDGRRVIADPGVHAYHDPQLREMTRASREHATPSIDGHEQAEVWSRFRCGWRPRVLRAHWKAHGEGWHFAGEGLAFGPARPRRLSRELVIGSLGLRVRDAVEGDPMFSVALTLAPDHQLEPSDAECTVKVGGATLVVRSSGAITVEPAYMSHRFGAREPTRRLRLRAAAGRPLEWSITAVS